MAFTIGVPRETEDGETGTWNAVTPGSGANVNAIDFHGPRAGHAVDSNGAGDMFAGAFLYAITRGEDFATAGRFASLAAGNIVAQYGPRLRAHDYAALRREFFGD